jgi:hypothetical protein
VPAKSAMIAGELTDATQAHDPPWLPHWPAWMVIISLQSTVSCVFARSELTWAESDVPRHSVRCARWCSDYYNGTLRLLTWKEEYLMKHLGHLHFTRGRRARTRSTYSPGGVYQRVLCHHGGAHFDGTIGRLTRLRLHMTLTCPPGQVPP